MNSIFLQAANFKKPNKTPIWLMRQAGRYMQEYRDLRLKAGSFINLCKNPKLISEVTLQPIKAFNLNAAILFSDILTIPDALGLNLSFKEGEGPVFSKNFNKVDDLLHFDIAKLSYVTDGINLTKQNLPKSMPLIGFSGSPWTLAAYMIEGGTSKDFHKIKYLAYSNLDLIHSILERLANDVIKYLSAQIKAGVDCIQIFDSWGGLLNPKSFGEFSGNYLNFVCTELKKLHPKIPIILFCKGSAGWLKKLFSYQADVIGIDQHTSIDLAVDYAKTYSKTIQGNLDPYTLFRNKNDIKKSTTAILEATRDVPHIFNLGHGINKYTDPAKVKYLVDLVHSF